MFNFYAFLRKKFSEYSDASGQQGTAVDDLAVKPTGLVMGDFNNSLVNERAINDITKWESMTEAELDAFGNKYFMPRAVGQKASGSVRIWFDYKFRFEVSTSFRAVSATSLTFSAVQPGYISASSFKVSSDSFGLYYVDIPIIADEKGNSYNIDAGKITAITGISFEYKTATNPDDISNGLNTETNEQYYKRLRYGVNDGSMMNLRSMYARLPEFFPSIISMFVAAPGSKYMTRDLVSGEDLSSPSKLATYLGKTQASNMVKHSAFYGSFPPEAWSNAADYKYGIPIPSSFDYPLTIEASDSDDSDPAYHGYPLDQEATDEMYSGMFFNDYSGYMTRETLDLFDIYDEEVGFTSILIPNNDWVYGSHYQPSGIFNLEDGLDPIQVMSFDNNEITLAGGSTVPFAATKDIGKRIGVKMTGSFVWPEIDDSDSTALNSNLQLMIGGVGSAQGLNVTDCFSGLGFGVRVEKIYQEITDADNLNYNAVVYIAHSERYGTAQVFAADSDIVDAGGHISTTDMGALAERQFRIETNEEYSFEFVVYDDLRVTLYMKKTNANADSLAANTENYLYFELASSVLNIFKEELLSDTTDINSHYGTMMKVALDSPSEDPDKQWTVSDLNCFDIDAHRSNMLFQINVKDMEDPLTVYMRAFGLGSVEGASYDGYRAYIWDREASSVASNTNSELTSGGWSILDGISNEDGTKQLTTGLLSHDIETSDRYVVNSRFGKSIFIMVQTTGTSKASINYGGDFTDDIQSVLKVDYMKVVSRASQSYHANNKADVYAVTYQNSEEPDSITTVLEKDDGDSYFEMNLDNDCQMPVAEIISVSAGGTSEEVQAISPTEYSVILTDDELFSSSQETVRIVLSDTSINTITVQYRAYPVIESVQEFFDGTDFGKIFGDILVKHKIKVDISFSLTYKGDLNTEQVISEIRSYVDDNSGPVFSVREMVTHLYDNDIVSYVSEPINVLYSKYDDDLDIETGEFTDTLTVKETEFFRITDLTVEKI